MKIAIFNPYNILLPGGVQDHIRAQAEELRSRGHEVTIVTPKPRKHADHAPEGTVFIGLSARVRAQSSTVDISAATDQKEVDEFYKHHHYDVVHFHEPVVPFVGRQLIAACPYPTVATLHAALPDTGIGRTLGSIKPYFRSVLQHVDVFTRVSPAAGEYLDDLLDGVEMYDVPNGVNVASFKPAKTHDPMTILFIGRLEKRKGPRYLIEAFAELKKTIPGAKLQLAGDGPEKQRLVELINQLGVEDVELLGYVADEKKYDLLRHATIACFPAIYGESFGIVLLEAMATGTPIVAGDNPGYSSVLRERGLLSLVNPKSTQEFSRRMQLLLEDKELHQLMSLWGLEYVKQFDYKNIVSQYEKIYRYAIKKHKAHQDE